MTEREQIEKAIAHLESQRAALGEAVVEVALGPLRQKLEALGGASATGAPEQRRQVTVLFADISGFTALSQDMDAELVRDTIHALWQRLDGVVTAHGGTIDKHIGDEVMALWGAESVREDDAERAVRAALAMQAELARLAANSKASLAMRIGINTGPAMLGAVGTTGEFTAMGDTVNTASRLQHSAPVGGVLISHDTYRLVRGIFDVSAAGSLEIKGKREPIRAYVVDRAKPRAFRMPTRGVDGIETEMVGRQAELEALQSALKETIGKRRTTLVTVCGEAGVGKSRLLFEFENWIELLPETLLLFKGRSAPALQDVPYRLLREVFAARFGILDSDPTQEVLEKFRAGTAGFLETAQADILGQRLGFDFRSSPAVAELLGSTSFGKQAALYLDRYFRNVAAPPSGADMPQTLLLFLEDIHWADDSTLDYVEHLAAELPDLPLLVVCLARPSIYERRPEWAAGRLRMDIKPLDAQGSGLLVDQVLRRIDPVPRRLKSLIIEGAEGNPYYVEELVKMLIDDRVIERGGERWTVDEGRLAGIRIPPTLTGILQARLDGLPSGEREVLQRASVVGRRFWDAAVASLSDDDEGRPAADIRPQLKAMQRRELVFRRAPSAFFGCEEFIFKHALLREVAYETVLLKLRRRLHARAALWLEINAGERLAEYLGLIAHHYQLAGENARAARCLRKQANALARTGSFRQALELYQRAWDLCPGDDKRQLAVIHTHAGNVLRQLGDFTRSRHRHSLALGLAREIQDGRLEINALDGLSWALMGQGRYDEAKRNLELALAHACRIDDRRGRARVLFHLAEVAYRQGDSGAAASYSAECLALQQELGDKQGIAGALRVIGFVHFMRGDYVEAHHYHSQSLSVYSQIGDRWGVAAGLTNQGESLRRQGRFAEAVARYHEAMKVYDEIADQLGAAIIRLNLGHSYIGLGDEAQARPFLRQSAERSWAIGAYSVLLEVLVAVALLDAKAGKHRRAAEVLGMVRAHPEHNDEIRANAEPAMRILEEAMGGQSLEQALEKGRGMDLAKAAMELIMDKG